jgi:5-(aminomethyl)-3-furanmethanol phosphate kinase
MTAPRELMVVKIGGSLFDLPQLGAALKSWLAEQNYPRILLVPGGGPLADVIRVYHRTHQLSEEQSHWLALNAMQVNAQLLSGLLGNAPVVTEPTWTGALAILDGHGFCRADEATADALPHSWGVTSDAVAARCAVVGQASALVLLKSVEQLSDNWSEAAQAGLVDQAFEGVVTKGDFQVRWVNFRAWLAGCVPPELVDEPESPRG